MRPRRQCTSAATAVVIRASAVASASFRLFVREKQSPVKTANGTTVKLVQPIRTVEICRRSVGRRAASAVATVRRA